MSLEAQWLDQAAALAMHGVTSGKGGPFGAAIVAGDKILAMEHNRVLERNDPTAHAEVLAIRAACEKIGSVHLDGCTLITTCEPCPMCLAAAHWAHIDRIVYAMTRDDAAAIGFSDAAIYAAMERPTMAMVRVENDAARALFATWHEKLGRQQY